MMPRASSSLITFLAAFCALVLFVFVAQAQTDNLDIGVNESSGGRQPVSDSSGFGLPYSSVLRDMTFASPEPLQPIHGTVRDQSNIGDNGGLNIFGVVSEGNRVSLPIGGGPALHNPSFQLGPLTLKVSSISATLLASDNINLTPTHHEYGAIAIMRMGVLTQIKISDNLHFATQFRFFYLPFVNRGGIAGFGANDPVADLFFSPLGGAQLVYNGTLSQWDLQVYDTFSMSAIHAGANLQYPVNFGFSSPHEEDQAGRYVFGDGTDIPPSGQGRTILGSTETSFLSLQNQTGFVAGRMIPSQTYLQFGAAHSEYWYDGDHGLVPNGRDTVFASADSVRETLRFKPSMYYSASHSDMRPGWSHRISGSIRGPASDNITLASSVGYFWRDTSPATAITYLGAIDHTIGPYTRHGLSVSQTVTEPVEEIERSLQYRIQQILGPDLLGDLYIRYSRFTSIDPGVIGSTEEGVGARLTYKISPRSHLRFTVTYTDVQSDNATSDELTTWRGRIDFYHQLTQTVHFMVAYRYQKIETSRAGGSYDESLLVLTVTKTF